MSVIQTSPAASPCVPPRLDAGCPCPRCPLLAEIGALLGTADPDRELHLESLQAVELKTHLADRHGVELPLEALFGPQTPAGLADRALAAAERGRRTGARRRVVADPAGRYKPFPLTDLQQGYWLGSGDGFGLGGRSAHFYLEADLFDLDHSALEPAFHTLIEEHDMLRAHLLPDGTQQVLADPGRYRIPVEDLRGLGPAAVEDRISQVRDALSHQTFDAYRWPLFDVRLQQLDDARLRLHLSLDLLFLDADSIRLLVQEWIHLALDPVASAEPPPLSFRDLVLAQAAAEADGAEDAAREYWTERLATLPPAPELPTRPVTAAAPRFVRRSRAVGRAAWNGLRERSRQIGVTPSTLLLTAYAEVLRNWSTRPAFTVNLTFTDRAVAGADARRVLGDFTRTLLLEADLSGTATFAERARALGARFVADLEHRGYSGVRVQRDMARQAGGAAAGFPVVFTSILGEAAAQTGPSATALVFEEVGAVSQTPQVLLDNQVLARDGGLAVSWDAVEEAFPAGVLDAMFDAYLALLERLAADPSTAEAPVVIPLPAAQAGVRAEVNATARDFPRTLLHAPFDEQASARPGAVAVITPGRTLTYGELSERADRIAWRLIELGVRPAEPVAVLMEKGWEQVAAVFGILRSDACYLPVDAAWPPLRIAQVLDAAGVRVVLTQSAHMPAAAADGRTALAVDDDAVWRGTPAEPLPSNAAGLDDLAYVIFTSGSTGTPKGVMITHDQAANTMADLNARHRVGPDDRVFGLSSLTFDLSVYDIFGVLGAGGTLVLPAAADALDPAAWTRQVRETGVTVWNSVPALVELLVDEAARAGERLPDSLRLVLMSGDWIPLSLPDRIRAVAAPDVELIGMGGATEAAVWSIDYRIGAVDPAWRSIPYGTPLANQTFHVLDEALRDRPDHVPGELFIGGQGVAAGYWGDPVRTAERFITRPDTGERLYRTGDLGSYAADGTIEFLGRADFQVKVNGHRIELGDVEAALTQHPAVAAAVAAAVGPRIGAKRLVAYLVAADGAEVSEAELRSHLADRLPPYMVPTLFVPLARLPLSANGKVDRGALPVPEIGGTAADDAPVGAKEQALGAIWAELLGRATPGRNENFYAAGGDSLLAIRIIAKAGAAGMYLTAQEFFAHPTIAGQAALVRSEPTASGPADAADRPVGMSPSQRWFFEQDFADRDHWNGMWPVFVLDRDLDPSLLQTAFHATVRHHDALRLRYTATVAGWTATIDDSDDAHGDERGFGIVDLSDVPDEDLTSMLTAHVARLNGSLNLTHGPVVKLTYFDLGPERAPRMLVSAHWLVMDYYSSRVFYEDLRIAYAQLELGAPIELPPTTAPLAVCHARLAERAVEITGDVGLWTSLASAEVTPLPRDVTPESSSPAADVNLQGDADRVFQLINPDEAAPILALAGRDGLEVRDVLLTALLAAVTDWSGGDTLYAELEGFGREAAFGAVDTSRTIARFSTLSPALLRRDPAASPGAALRSVRDQLRAIPEHGVGYGLLRYLHPDAEVRAALRAIPAPEVGFNYWGDVTEYFAEGSAPTEEAFGGHRGAAGHRWRVLDLMALVMDGAIGLVWTYGTRIHRRETVEALADGFHRHLNALAAGTTTLPNATREDTSR